MSKIKDIDIKLKMLRIENRKTQKEVAAEMGIPQNILSGYESGATTPGPENIKKMALYYHVPSDYLLGIDNRRQIMVDDTLSDAEFSMLIQAVDLYCRAMGKPPKNDSGKGPQESK